MSGAVRKAAVSASGLTIYDELDDNALFFPDEELEEHLCSELVGREVPGENRTKAKIAKELVAEALGYPVPSSFQRTHPRFPGQDLDVFAQKSNNVQIYNQDLDPARRYVILQVDDDAEIRSVRVVNGEMLARIDEGGTLTSKFQARRKGGDTGSKLVSAEDTELFRQQLSPVDELSDATLAELDPLGAPEPGQTLSISALYARLLPLLGTEIEHLTLGERTRADTFHKLVCMTLGLRHADSGQFPDITSQALEVKLQYRGTIDLGLVFPDSIEGSRFLGPELRHCDTRYLVAYTDKAEDGHYITAIVLSTGADFFTEFNAMGGLGKNDKLQIHLPGDFFAQSECPPD